MILALKSKHYDYRMDKCIWIWTKAPNALDTWNGKEEFTVQWTVKHQK